MRTSQLWQEEQQGLPKNSKGKISSVVKGQKKGSERPQSVSTKDILGKNLFDPDRGTGKSERGPAPSDSMKRIQSMVLLGTAILGNSRLAILKESSDPRRVISRKSQPPLRGPLRLKLGDNLEGFKLSEIHENKVVFTKGDSKVELLLDFLRKEKKIKKKRKVPKRAKRKPRRIPKKSTTKG